VVPSSLENDLVRGRLETEARTCATSQPAKASSSTSREAAAPERTQPHNAGPQRRLCLRHTARMHLLDPDDASVIDGELVCAAVAQLPEFELMHGWVKRFALLADPTRLTVLLCIHHAGEICVTDLAAAAGVKDTTVSQALRLLRAHLVVTARRAGRIVYYSLADGAIAALLEEIDRSSNASSRPDAHRSGGSRLA
jgi:DNA-binding transcriptional ArsR family regulator